MRYHLHVHSGSRAHATVDPLVELEPGMQVGLCGASQVMLHLPHGGGPWTLHDDGLVISHAGVGTAVGAWGLPFVSAIAKLGARTMAISRIMRAVIWPT